MKRNKQLFYEDIEILRIIEGQPDRIVFTIPNPSSFHFAEQKRIIAKLEKILPLCERLK